MLVNSVVFSRKHRSHSIKVLPLSINKRLQSIRIIPNLAEAALLFDVGFDGCAVGPLVDSIAAAVKNLVEREQATSNSKFDQFGTLVRFRLPTGRAR